ncbi:manganese catalase family protein [Longicatena caecimuris]|uniref:manganese catalase family protein n=1 Tax=Longicatena caecimuris TaxID=1796635 RepID=UPI003AB5FEB4
MNDEIFCRIVCFIFYIIRLCTFCPYAIAARENLYNKKQRVYKAFGLCCSYEVAAEQKARTTYDNLIREACDPDVIAPLVFLREREIVHFQRFGEALAYVQKQLDSGNYYRYNPAFDK